MNVRNLLQQHEHLDSQRYAGDLDAVDTLLDLAAAIGLAKLNDRQRHFLELFYVQGYTQQEISDFSGVAQPNVARSIKQAETKIQKIYDGWGD